MRFWDSSAVVPLLVEEPASGNLRRLLRTDGEVIVWWGTPVECGSAIARLERDNALSLSTRNAAITRLRTLELEWREVLPSTKVRDLAQRLLRTHTLRSADALQLAAALVAADDDPAALDFVCLEERLTVAAQREGFTVAP